jgi:hypothetical protein
MSEWLKRHHHLFAQRPESRFQRFKPGGVIHVERSFRQGGLKGLRSVLQRLRASFAERDSLGPPGKVFVEREKLHAMLDPKNGS